uniref:chitin-binding domain protein cbd-1-like isoform X3 n=1 Tax=Ciona intestinalis TaxID=7719 RepID=UPI000EF539BA|nr:chitin-binding domain protein cbd-1-like isoform X3 [Ciona intestinalis]|eukprot:XP_026694521.1 chitin-binding domain protein cbd-1-like isoform X3 [Ciona intestinalis]
MKLTVIITLCALTTCALGKPVDKKAELNSKCFEAGAPISSKPFEKPGDCDHFYQCSNGYLYTMPCAPGTAFSPALSVCDHPENVDGCGGSASTPAPPTKPADKECLDSDGNAITKGPFANPDDCALFYQCVAGQLYTLGCPPDLVYNPALSYCDYPKNVPSCGGVAPTSAPETTTKPFDDECVDANNQPTSTGPFENPNDCNSFYQCSNGYLHIKICPDNTYFNPAISVCDHDNGECGSGSGSSGSGGSGTPEVTLSPFDKLCMDSDGKPISSNPFEKPGDCDNFYQCSNGYLHVMPCAPGTAFNPAISVCDHPYNVPGCGAPAATTTTEAPKPTTKPFDKECLDSNGKPMSTGPFENPGECDSFYQCSNGYLHVMPCAPGTAFNPAISVCDHPYNVPGCGAPAATTTTEAPKPTTKPFDKECLDSNSKPISTGPFENPGECDSFYQCSNGYLHVMPCAPGTAFNPAISVCDHPYNVPGCGAPAATTTTEAPKPTTKPFDKECLDSNGKPISTGPFENPGECDSFYQCSNGYLHVMPCAPGTAFNPAISVCDHPYNVPGCGAPAATTTTEAPKPTTKPFDKECLDSNGKPISTGPFENPGECDSFYQCSNGYLHVMPCAPGTAFNPAISVCDHPYNVPGCGAPAATTTTEAPKPTTKPFDKECLDSNGKPISTGPFENPGECDSFYQCSNGYLHVMPCAPGTAFNPAISVCDHPYNVPGCGAPAATTTTEAPKPTTKPFDKECLDSDGKPFSSNPFEKNGDCDNFYQCSNGYLYTMPCAPGTAFNPAIGVCDYPYNVPGCGGTSAPTTVPPTQAPTIDPKCVDSNGKPMSTGPFEKPGDCDHFYQCSNGYLHVMPCGPGTAFNPAISVCDWPYNVPGCGAPAATTTTEAPKTTSPPFNAQCVDSNGKPMSTGPFEKPEDCDNFYQCSNGYLHTMPCAPGTAFNPAIGVCDWPKNVPGCGASSGGSPTCKDADDKPLSTGPFEKPGDCTHFYQCGAGILYVMPCASGTVFNPTLSVCDWSHNVPGC